MTHTPSPWQFTANMYGIDNMRVFGVEDKNAVCPQGVANCGFGEGCEANAHLIAAAPEMLKCLQAIVARIHGVYDDPALIEWGGLHHDSDQDILKHAEKLITKAKGKSK